MKYFRDMVLGIGLLLLSGAGLAAEAPMATLLIDHAVHFQSAEGTDLALDSGSYSVAPAAGGGLRLSSANGNSFTIPATAATHDEKLAEPRAVIVPAGTDEQHLVLLLPDGKRFEAIGSLSGIRSRGLARPALVSNVALQSALVMGPAVLAQPAAPAAALPAPPNTAYTAQPLPLAPIEVQPSCVERPGAGQPPAAELEPSYGRLSLSAAGPGRPAESPAPSGAWLGWRPVPGAKAYVVERAVDGSNVWSVLATTCANKERFMYTPLNSATGWSSFFDISGGVIPRTTYAYRVTAIGAPGTGGGFAGQVWWNVIKWTAPDPIAPQWISATMMSTGALRVHWRFDSPGNPYMPHQPQAYVLSTPGGWSLQAWGGTRHDPCPGYNGCSWDFPNPPSGTQVFTLTALWQIWVNGTMQTVATTQSDMTVTVP